MTYVLLAPKVYSGAPLHFRILFASVGRLSDLDDSQMFPIDFAKMKEAGIAAACPDFVAAKEAGKMVANMNRMPVMLIDGTPIGQIAVIKRILAKRLSLLGDADLEGAQCDMIQEHLQDIKKEYNDAKKEGKPEVVEEWFKTKLPEWMAKIEGALPGQSGFAVGSKLTMADTELYTIVTSFFDNLEGVAAAVAGCPKILKSVELVKALPGIVELMAIAEKNK